MFHSWEKNPSSPPPNDDPVSRRQRRLISSLQISRASTPGRSGYDEWLILSKAFLVWCCCCCCFCRRRSKLEEFQFPTEKIEKRGKDFSLRVNKLIISTRRKKEMAFSSLNQFILMRPSFLLENEVKPKRIMLLLCVCVWVCVRVCICVCVSVYQCMCARERKRDGPRKPKNAL